MPALAGTPADAVPAGPRGALVIIGGALRADTADVWSRVVALAGGPGARIAVFPSAAGNPERSGQNTAAILRRYGADPFVVPIAVQLAGTEFRAAADDAALARRIREAGGAFFVGGDQARITQALVRADGSRSAALDAVWELYRGGGVVAGTSAGAAVMSRTMFRDVPDVLAALSAELRDGNEMAQGLGFVGDKVLIDQHFLVRGRFARLLPAMLKHGYKLGLGIDENSALVVRGEEIEVVGYRGALLIDLSQATAATAATPTTASGPAQVRNVLVSYLDRGDRYHLGAATHEPGQDKRPVSAAAGQATPALYSNDILANNAIVDLMERLVSSTRKEALGLASGDPRNGGTGYAFRLAKTPATRAYASTTSEAMSITGVVMDVEPVEMAQPVFRYRPR
jgi:cyanophycinase